MERDGPLPSQPQHHLDHVVLQAAASGASVRVERLISLGPTRVDWEYPDGADFADLADTEGNVFCVFV